MLRSNNESNAEHEPEKIEKTKSNQADDNGSLDSKTRSTFVLLITFVVVPMFVNWLSDLWSPTLPVLVLIVALVFSFVAFGGASQSGLGKFLSTRNRELIMLGFTSLLIGVAVGCIALIPLFENVDIRPFDTSGELFGSMASNYTIHGYEVLSVVPVVALAALASYRAPDLAKQITFIASSALGIAISYDVLRGYENSFLATFFGTLVVAAAGFLIIHSMPKMFKVIGSFIGIGKSANGKAG